MHTRSGRRPPRAVTACLLVLCFLLPSGDALLAGEPRTAKYVILMIGDGMGGAQRTLAEFYRGALKRKKGQPVQFEQLVMNSLPAHGRTTTYSLDSVITDSAASGTALACGQKTNNRRVGMDATGKRRLKSLAAVAHERGMRVGIVTSVSIDHATPASFYAHQPDRDMYYEISVELPGSGFDFFAGAARGALPKYAKGRKSPVDLAREKGYQVARSRKELAALKPGTKAWAFNETCDPSAAMFYEIDRPKDHISLEEFTAGAIELLDNPRGFFLMVEGGKIDWACHANDAATVVKEVLAFDRAVAAAHRFYEEHRDDTLLVVTADHECGGLSLGAVTTQYDCFPEKLQRQRQSGQAFALEVEKLRDNDVPLRDALPGVLKQFGIPSVRVDELAALGRAYSASMRGEEIVPDDPMTYLLYGGFDPLTIKCTQVLARHAGVAWTTFAHTAVPVPTSAAGVGHERFNGYYDNTELSAKVLAALPAAATAKAAAK